VSKEVRLRYGYFFIKLAWSIEKLPAFSPNLNLIERVWKFIRKKSLNCKYYETFDEFKLAIMDCIGKFSGEYTTELESLLTWKFQTFSAKRAEEKVA
jgi:transposase